MLSEEEKKAIERVEDTFYENKGKGINNFQKITLYEDGILDILKLLNIIEKLQKENKEKDKQIDLIIEEYEYNDRINFKNFCEDELRKDSCIQDCKLCAKHYFEKLVKEKGE